MPENINESSKDRGSAARYSLLAAAALSLPLLALAVSAAVFPTSVPFRVFSISGLFIIQFIIVVYLIAGPAALGVARDGLEGDQSTIFDPEIEERLQVFEEAGKLLGGSLRLDDMFRLVSTRSSDIVPVEDPVLLISASDNRTPRVIFSSPSQEQVTDLLRDAAAEAESKHRSVVTSVTRSEGTIRWLAIPLHRSGEVFGVIAGRLVESGRSDGDILILLDAIAERVSPLIFAAISLEEREANALVDSLTGLPNKRAFDLVLANRIAEAQRSRGGARLMVLAIDVKEFSKINSRFGHATGDKLLEFVAVVIKDQLRKMDLVARSGADEFLAVLPSAGKDTAESVVGRIRDEFVTRKFELPNGEPASIEVDIGYSVFGAEAGSVTELIASARAELAASKSSRSNQVIRFPTKHSN